MHARFCTTHVTGDETLEFGIFPGVFYSFYSFYSLKKKLPQLSCNVATYTDHAWSATKAKPSMIAPFDPSERYVTSWLFPPVLLACSRLLLSLYAFLTIFFIFGWDASHGHAQALRRSFSYFTDLTFWGLAFYFLVSGLHTFQYARTGLSWLGRWPRSLQAAHAVFYSTVVTFPFLVTIVYWAILYSSPWFPVVFNAWSNVWRPQILQPLLLGRTPGLISNQTSRHLLNSFFAIFEIIIPRTDPLPLIHLLFLVIILALYLALAYITHAVQGFYTYDFLDPGQGRGRVAGYVFGILAGVCVVFGLVWCCIRLRKWLTETKWHLEGKFSAKARRRNQDIEMNAALK